MNTLNLSLMAAALATCSLGAPAAPREEAPRYQEPYRQQYHFSPEKGWIGDPCGLLKYDGKYRLYWWGGAESDDLVHWHQVTPYAIREKPDGIASFTGSVVVDREGSAGYGKNALIAAFTSFDEATKKQSQSIAFSTDGGDTFRYYDLNPVLDIWSTEFRDPTVIWHEPSQQWVMAVAKALEKKVGFYGSKDLKHWEWLSDFGPMGNSERSWECPDLFLLPVDGDPDNKKWVLVLSINWAQEQYFTGDFDGKQFVADPLTTGPNYVDHGLDYYASRTFQNFDDPNEPVYTLGWVATWDYAPHQPSEYGKGFWSIPRELGLRTTPDGLRLVQAPAPQLETLRGKPFVTDRQLGKGVQALPSVSAMKNVYEMQVEFRPKDGDTFGFYLCEGDGRKLTLSYDSHSQRLTVDRTHVADRDIPMFERVAHCRIPMEDGVVSLRIFVDKSSVEIFAAGGERVLTLQTYPGADQTGASVFSLKGKTRMALTVWPLSPAVPTAPRLAYERNK